MNELKGIPIRHLATVELREDSGGDVPAKITAWISTNKREPFEIVDIITFQQDISKKYNTALIVYINKGK